MNVYVISRKGRNLMLRWHDGKRWREKSSGTTRRRDAERMAANFARELEDGIHDDQTRWAVFRVRYERQRLGQLAQGSRDMWKTAANWLESLEDPEWIEDIDGPMIARYTAALSERVAQTSVAAYLRTLRPAFNWAKRLGWLRVTPPFDMPKRARGVSKTARSRPIIGEELDKLLMITQTRRPQDYVRWQDFIKGLYHSGLRAGELLELSWTPGALLWLDDSGQYPLIHITAEGEKAHTDRFQPVTPEFWSLVVNQHRHGRVFPIDGLTTGRPMGKKRVLRILSGIGRRAGIVTDPTTGKHATSHDIGRRAFATRLASRLQPQELAKWMRHEDVSTAQNYYYQPDAIALSKRIWEDKEP